MTFNSRSGTRGAAQPGGRLLRWMNAWAIRRIRRGNANFVGGTKALVLTTVGRKSGNERQTPVNYFPGKDGSWLIVASAAGAAGNPAWYLNLSAHPDKVRVEVGGRTVEVTAEQLHGAARDRAWQQIAGASSRFAQYQDKTDRVLPVIRLTPRSA